MEQHDGLALAAAIRAGKLSAEEALDASLARIEETKELGAVRHVDVELGRAQARALDQGNGAAKDAPFFGVPFLLKDLGSPYRGLPIVLGSALIARTATTDSDSIFAEKLRAAGLNTFGVTTASEFGLALSSEPAIGPVARNPLDSSRTPGGSSGGAGTAVASGAVALAHATDAGGSTRVPAACCGLVGLKPSRGAISAAPSFGNWLSGIVGELVVSRSVRDTAAMFDATAGNAMGPFAEIPYDSLLATLEDAPGPLRIGVVATADDVEVGPERSVAIEAAAMALEALGHRLVPVDAARLGEIRRAAARVFDRVISVNMARNMAGVDISGDEVSEMARAVYARGIGISGVELQTTELGGVAASHAMWRLFEEVDVLLAPMLATAPPKIGAFPLDHGNVELHWSRFNTFAPYAMLGNATGVPAVTVPFGADADGLPLPVQIFGPIGGDGLLLRVARLLEREKPWPFITAIAGLA